MESSMLLYFNIHYDEDYDFGLDLWFSYSDMF
jgi:hypothetical protein